MTDTFCSLRTPCGGACGLSAHVSHTVHVCRDSRCALCHSTTPTQATGSGTMIWHKPLKRDEVDCANCAQLEARPIVPSPDPRDAFIAEQEVRYFKLERELNDANARIAELEAALRDLRGEFALRGIALREVCKCAEINDNRTDWERLQAAGQIARAVLMPAPERDMTITQEELDA